MFTGRTQEDKARASAGKGGVAKNIPQGHIPHYRPARVKHDTAGHMESGRAFPVSVSGRRRLRRGQLVVVDTDGAHVSWNTGEEGFSESKYPAIASNISQGLYLSEGSVTLLEDGPAFRSMIRLMGRLFENRKSVTESYNRRWFQRLKHVCPEEGKQDIPEDYDIKAQNDVARALAQIIGERPPGTTTTLRKQGESAGSFGDSDVGQSERLSLLKQCETELGARVPHRERYGRADAKELVDKGRASTAPLAPLTRPRLFEFHINVWPDYAPALVRALLPLVDTPYSEDWALARWIRINPVEGIGGELSNIRVGVGDERSFGKVSKTLLAIGQEHPEYFREGEPPMTETLFPGVAWCENPFVYSVWDMGDDLRRSVDRFGERAGQLLKQRQNRGAWTKFWEESWIEGAINSFGDGVEKFKSQKARKEHDSDYDYIQALLSLDLQVKQQKGKGLSDNVNGWLRHYLRFVSRPTGDVPMPFLLNRCNLLKEALTQQPRDFAGYISACMARFEKEGLDFSQPHMSLPVPAFQDEGAYLMEGLEAMSITEASQDEWEEEFVDKKTAKSAEVPLFKPSGVLAKALGRFQQSSAETGEADVPHFSLSQRIVRTLDHTQGQSGSGNLDFLNKEHLYATSAEKPKKETKS
ncbi:hypothetical protein FUAX_17410 [Fulvitalea axinellae]|uniref:Uncharacterized protein n=1 Tax=Fulvitalea axinellae TaxID=1182444 RepID=A0AAU9CS96_9BACT|nr:hypothetical protein FUAX_17410 [Fulvitalea axinellae]